MNIRGLHPFTLVDFPGRIACIIFVGECNFRCPYCHNPCLVFDPESQPRIKEEAFFYFLEKRRGKLEGVVISGGEPILQQDLLQFIKKVKDFGFLVKLDTNGSMPERVFDIHREVGIDALGVDYKAPIDKYAEIAVNSLPELGKKVLSVIDFALKNNILIDVRTTVHRALLSIDDLRRMRFELNSIGLETWTLQQFNPVETIDDNLLQLPTYSDRELVRIAEELGNDTRVRGLKGMIIK
ncbi:anaerobic ribonucleoside-triphosphate reductase activating protein [Lentisphaerota bacterium ZTH]|nr:anaerobic ribonucleoside-triphosphate reductase activating protein [Lentisphaerota bacterium]WET06507.1 anaerobic ribonucleoside-triphosphate reductase activating protein [Lentisphaerota bacterium ZTH]